MLWNRTSWVAAALAVAIGFGFVWASSHFRDHKSTTVDETLYLRGGLAIYWTGSFHVLEETGVAPLPTLLTYWLPALANEADGRSLHSRFPSMGEHGDAEMVRQARLVSSLLIGLPLVLTVYAWLYRRRGLGVACAGGLLMAASPLMLSHGTLATTDACLTLATLISLAALVRYQKRQTTASLIGVGVAVGAVIASKYSGLFILPVAVLAIFASHLQHASDPSTRGARWEATRDALLALPVVLVAAALVIILIHGLDPSGFWTGLKFQLSHAQAGHQAYLLGEKSSHGWWHYYPIVFAAKSSEAELALVLVVLWAGGWRLRSLDWRDRDFAFLLWMCTVAIYAGAVLISTISNGPRYLMPLYPLLILAALDSLSVALARWPRWQATLCVALVGAQVAASATTAPDWLAYVNRLAGGPERGHELLISDSIDWGQDLPALNTALADLRCERVSFVYFGTARFEDYGIEADRYRQSRGHFEDYDCLAISVNNLYSLFADYQQFEGLRALEPAGRAGHSIRIFRPSDPEVARALGLAGR
ncbi:MAG: phospholipid carrier-dependent glycosyltransferase [bacterium]|nr:phospholipid carrier-dependent glycosyltransferase [bacterium]